MFLDLFEMMVMERAMRLEERKLMLLWMMQNFVVEIGIGYGIFSSDS